MLGYHSLDSGVFYRALALHVKDKEIFILPQTEQIISFFAESIEVTFKEERVFLFGTDRTEEIRSQEIGALASKVSALPKVREALLGFQLSMRKYPGLVADGRDMGEIFDTPFRFFLEVSIKERAQRRLKELRKTNPTISSKTILDEIKERDKRDTERSVSPLKPHPKAVRITGDGKKPQEVAEEIVSCVLKYTAD